MRLSGNVPRTSFLRLIPLSFASALFLIGCGDDAGSAETFETTFMQEMIDHHAMAVDMGEVCVEKATHEELRTTCENIVTSQTAEISQFQSCIRYTPEGGSVQIEARSEGPRAILSVLDSGPGIPEEERARVFDRFYRVLGTGESGSGLGLAIVKRIAELHGAEVRLEEGVAGRGLRVVVRLPRLED